MQLNNYRGLCKDVTFPVENAAEIVTVVLDYRANFQIDSWKFSSFLAHFVIFILYITRSLVNEISPLKKKKRERERILKRFRKFGEKKICSEINL